MAHRRRPMASISSLVSHWSLVSHQRSITPTARFSFHPEEHFSPSCVDGYGNRARSADVKLRAAAAIAKSRQSKAAMRAITVLPGIACSARLEEVAEPAESDGPVLVRTLALGVCGTDREILNGSYGFAPPGQQRLVLGHESLGVIETAPDGCGLVPGDLVVGVVRRPDPEPCVACAIGEWDMCRNGRYTERGIKERHGYGAERFRIEPEFAIRIDPELGILGVLLEPASILAKAWDHIERIGHRARAWQPKVLLVTGAGPIGLLAALMGMQRGLDVHVLDHNKGGPKEAIVRDLGGTYHSDPSALERLAPDILIECTGVPAVIRACLDS